MEEHDVIQSVYREVDNLIKIRHNHVIKLLDFCADDTKYYMITELYQMNLLLYLNIFKNVMTEEKVRDIFHMIV